MWKCCSRHGELYVSSPNANDISQKNAREIVNLRAQLVRLEKQHAEDLKFMRNEMLMLSALSV